VRELAWASTHVVVTPPLAGKLVLTLDGGEVVGWPMR
jgi:hypothetical protein